MRAVSSPRGTVAGGAVPRGRFPRALTVWIDRQTRASFLLPVVVLLLFVSIFPLVLSAYLSLIRFQFVPGGFRLTFVGLANFRRLIAGIEQEHFLGAMRGPSLLGWIIVGVAAIALAVFVLRALRAGPRARELPARLVFAAVAGPFVWLLARTLTAGGRPGTLTTTVIYAACGIVVQYWLGLGLAYLTAQNLAGRRLFRVAFLLPMMITPVGIAYTFRIIADLGKGPFAPLWQALGLAEVSWANDPWGARAVVMIGDIWQWTPFMFIVLLAALESQPPELVEAAMVDGASRWQTFWRVTWPQLLPVSSTLVLIRLIEAFKIVDLPNVLTNGGPGTATESLTLHAFIAWRTLDIGGSAAVAYALLFAVTFAAVSYVNLVHRRVAASL
jgi:multiple sugar transport system permease protein